MLDSEEGGVERTKISMTSYFFFLFAPVLYNETVDFWAIKVSEGDAARLGKSYCYHRHVSIQNCFLKTLPKFLGLQWIIYANHEDSKEELQGLCG